MNVRLLLLGPPMARVGERPLVLACERRTQLLAYLALRRAWVARSELAGLLWPDQQSRLAYTNLRKALFRLQSLEWAGRIEAQGSSLRFDVATDVLSFETALREQRLADAIALYRGDLLAGFDDDGNDAWSGWLGFERDRLRVAWRGAVQQRLAADIDPTEATDLAARWLASEPLDEDALRSYMQWLIRAGQGGRAAQAYREFAARLHEELGLTPSAELLALHQSLTRRALPATGAADPGRRAAVDNGFIGRAAEMQRIAALLQGECRLLSLIGPGGVGKTRLAQHAAQVLAASHADGAVFVSLEDVESGADLSGRLAHALRVPLKGQDDALEQVIGALRDRRMLLVLDNFEHLADAAAMLGCLLDECAQLRILVTSRVRLALAAEWLLPLEGLPCPDEEDRDHVDAFDAARLFVRAAQRVHPALAPAAEAAAIVDICRQVRGMPLALELAAAWTRVLSCDAIATELRRGTELLRTADGTHPDRHSGIDAVFDQSWRMLSEAERGVLARLSVFHGSFSLDAARAVTNATLPVLAALVDKSLLAREDGRLHLHPLLQQQAAARLDEDATAQVQAAHAGYFHRVMAQIEQAIESADRVALQLVDQEFENVRRAWQWSMASGKVEILGQRAKALLAYCDHRGCFLDGLALLQQAAASAAARADPRLHAYLLSKVSHLEYRLDRYAKAEANAAEALAVARRGRDRATCVQALNVLGTCAYRLGRYEESRRHFKQALASVSSEDESQWMANALDNLALIEKTLGRYDEALRLSMQSLAEHRRRGAGGAEALCLNNLGSLYLAMNDDAAAAVHLRESLAICERDGLAGIQGLALVNLAEVAMRAGDLAAAETHARRAVDVAGGTGNRAIVAWARTKQALLRVREGDVAAARGVLAEAVRTTIALRIPSLVFDGLRCFAEILVGQNATRIARTMLAYAADHPSASPTSRLEALAVLARIPVEPAGPAACMNIELDELLQRIVIESDMAYASLIAQLQGRAASSVR